MNYIDTIYCSMDIAVFLIWGAEKVILSEAQAKTLSSRLANLPPGGEWRNLHPLTDNQQPVKWGDKTIYAIDYYAPATEVE